MIRDDQLTPEIRDYLNSLPPWQDTTDGWLVPRFYEHLSILRNLAFNKGKKKEEYTDAVDKFCYIFSEYENLKLPRLPFEDTIALGAVITDLYNYWKSNARLKIPESIIYDAIYAHTDEILYGSGEYIDLDDIIL